MFILQRQAELRAAELFAEAHRQDEIAAGLSPGRMRDQYRLQAERLRKQARSIEENMHSQRAAAGGEPGRLRTLATQR